MFVKLYDELIALNNETRTMSSLQKNIFIISFFFILFIVWNSFYKDIKISTNISNFQDENNSIERTFKSEHINNNFKIDNKYDRKKNVYKYYYNKKNSKYIILSNDVISIVLNKNNGTINKVYLLKYSDHLGSNSPFCLLDKQSDFIYQASEGLILKKDGKITNLKLDITNKQNAFNRRVFFSTNPSKTELRIPFTWIDLFTGVEYKKTFILYLGKYFIEIENTVLNNSGKAIDISFFNELKQTVNIPINYANNNLNFNKDSFSSQKYRSIAYSTDLEKYKKSSLNTINDKIVSEKTKHGWIAMIRKYFVAAWIPKISKMNNNIIYTNNKTNNILTLGYESEPVHLLPNKSFTFVSKLWTGPSIQNKMLELAPNLDLTLDYGYLWFISKPLFYILSLLHFFIGNWGWSIVFLTIFIRSLMYPLAKSQYISMEKVKLIQPKIDLIKTKYKNDKQKMSKEIIKLYNLEKINPFGGCLPIIVQMPIFLGLYYMLVNSVELRHAPFLLWINDLSDRDPYFIFPIFMGYTMWIIQRSSSNEDTESVQKHITNLVPILFTLCFLYFPSGLVLYYITSNIFTILQQKIISLELNNKS
ncbi:MAG: membrane protein insertase YidC [Buchnera aphidicola (Tetraneura sorini)]